MAAQRPLRAALFGGAALLIPLASAGWAQAVEDTEILDLITVEGKRGIATDTATPVTGVDQEEMDDRQAGTISELVDSVPGVTLVNGGSPSGSGLNIRGFGATPSFGTDQMVMIQVDGATQGSEELYRIGTQLYTDPELYKYVEVIRGTVGSFEHGSGVVGGMIRLETKDASDFTGGVPGFRLRQSLTVATNGDGVVSSSILAWQPTEDLEFLAHYALRAGDDQVDGDGNPVGSVDYRLPSYHLKARYTFGQDRDHAISLSYADTRSSERDVPYDQFGTTAGFFGNVDRDIASRTSALRYEWNPLGNNLIDLTAQLSYSDQKIDQTYIPGSSPAGDMVAGTANADHRYETTQLLLRNRALFSFGQTEHDLRAGIEIINKDRLAANSAPGGTDERVAVFLVDDIGIGTGFTVTPGLRYETQRIRAAAVGGTPETFNNEALMGGLSARYEFANGFALFASGAYTENLPILDDAENNPPNANYPRYMTQSQKARTWEIGGSYTMGDVFSSGDALALKANYYNTRVWDVTSYAGVTDIGLQGIELESSYSLASGLYTDFNANFSEGENLTPGREGFWSNSPADRLRLTVGQRFGNELDVSWEGVAHSRFTRTTGAETPGAVVHNVRVTYRPESGMLEGTELRLGVENLFDTTYRPHLATRNAPGRNFKISIGRTF